MSPSSSKSAPKRIKRPRRPAISDPTRENLINAAGRIFADHGYRATTIREICDGAGENVAAVNYHFGDKLGLYTEVVHQSVHAAGIEAIKSALDQHSSPEDILRAVIRARLRGICRGDRPDWHFKILTHELAQPTPALEQLINNVGRPIFNRLLELIGRMIDLPPTDDKTRLCAISVMGQILAYAFAQPLLAGVWPDLKMTPDQIEQIADHIGDFSLAYIHSFRSQQGSTTQASQQRVTA
jgi:TetR/AcrR family transcriptional regulator, regulator of cefoperazone and chloramphenicol sensitivity